MKKAPNGAFFLLPLDNQGHLVGEMSRVLGHGTAQGQRLQSPIRVASSGFGTMMSM